MHRKMKRSVTEPILGILALLFAPAIHAGISYDFRSVSRAPSASVAAGSVEAEGAGFRMELREGSAPPLQSGTALFSRDGTTIEVVDPAARTYYDLDLAQIMGRAGSIFGPDGVAAVRIGNVKTSARDAGPGGTVQGYATRRMFSLTSCDLSVDSMGQKLIVHVRFESQRWTTSAIDARYMNVLRTQNLKSGIPELDRLLADANPSNGFPLRQVTSLRITSGATGTVTFVTETNVSAIRMQAIDAKRFVVPPGYRKVASPFAPLLR